MKSKSCKVSPCGRRVCPGLCSQVAYCQPGCHLRARLWARRRALRLAKSLMKLN